MLFLVSDTEGIAVGLDPAAFVTHRTFIGRCLKEAGTITPLLELVGLNVLGETLVRAEFPNLAPVDVPVFLNIERLDVAQVTLAVGAIRHPQYQRK